MTLVGAVAASESYGLVVAGIRARVNLSYVAAGEDPRLAYRVAREGVELLRHLGMRDWPYMLSNAAELALRIGDWDWALPEVEEAAQSDTNVSAMMRRAEIHGLRGANVSDELQASADRVADRTEIQAQATVDEVRAAVALARGDTREALDFAERSYRRGIGPDSTAPLTAARAAGWLRDDEAARDALGVIEGQHGRVAEAARREAGAVVAVLEGRRDEGMAGFIDAIRRWRELGLEFEVAMCALDLLTIAGPGESEARAAGETAGALFERVGAPLHLALLARAMGAVAPAPATQRETPVVDDTRASATRTE